MEGMNIESISIYDIQGQLITNQAAAAQTTRVNVNQLPAGMYIVKAIDKTGNVGVKRFIKE
jgi:hypothetical protein